MVFAFTVRRKVEYGFRDTQESIEQWCERGSMALTPEEEARKTIDEALHNAGWDVQDMHHVNVHAAPGVAIREFPLKAGYGTADYLLYVNGQAAGALEAKKAGTTLSGVKIQTAKYSERVPPALPPLMG
jgi:type I restriction enzyme R subunit